MNPTFKDFGQVIAELASVEEIASTPLDAEMLQHFLMLKGALEMVKIAKAAKAAKNTDAGEAK